MNTNSSARLVREIDDPRVDAMVGAGHRAQASIYASAQAWSPWFGDAGLDHTFLAEDGWTGRLWLLCLTGGG